MAPSHNSVNRYGNEIVRLLKALIRPCAQYVSVPGLISPPLSIRSRTQVLVEQRPEDQMRPATPATWGVAIEVPLIVPYFTPRFQIRLLWSGAVERMEAPGAATSTQL